MGYVFKFRFLVCSYPFYDYFQNLIINLGFCNINFFRFRGLYFRVGCLFYSLVPSWIQLIQKIILHIGTKHVFVLCFITVNTIFWTGCSRRSISIAMLPTSSVFNFEFISGQQLKPSSNLTFRTFKIKKPGERTMVYSYFEWSTIQVMVEVFYGLNYGQKFSTSDTIAYFSGTECFTVVRNYFFAILFLGQDRAQAYIKGVCIKDE